MTAVEEDIQIIFFGRLGWSLRGQELCLLSQVHIGASTILLSSHCVPSVQNNATSSSTVNGYPVNTVFDCQLRSRLFYSVILGYLIGFRRGKAGTPGAVVTTMGEIFLSCQPPPWTCRRLLNMI